jgi:hypothetical protein
MIWCDQSLSKYGAKQIWINTKIASKSMFTAALEDCEGSSIVNARL